MTALSVCIVIPVYNHGAATKITVERIHGQTPDIDIILVDDASSADCHKILFDLAANSENILLTCHEKNQGKGGAVKTGLKFAEKQGFSHALQVDADGQHDIEDIPKFIKLGQSHPKAIICGLPQFDSSVPKLRLYGRYATHIWIWINTLSLEIKDSMCGFRLYPLSRVNAIIKDSSIGNRMDFDPELLVRWHWAGLELKNIKTNVQYPIDGISHFRGFEDNYLISKMHTKLFFGMLLRLPRLILRHLDRSKGQN